MLEVLVTKIKLADARAQLRLKQTELAELAEVARQVIQNAEHGLTIRRLSAYAILGALNQERAKKGMLPLEIGDIAWKIQGEEQT